MALIDGLSFTQNSDISNGVVSDTSDYGVGGNQARSATANYLLWSKTDSKGVRTFDNPNEGNVFSTLSYQVDTLVDGLYEAILLRITPYSNVANYVEQQQSGNVITQYASIVYDGAVYQCIAPVTGVAPTDPTGGNYWVAVADLSTLLGNTNIHQFIQTVYISIRAQECIAKKFIACGCGCGGELDKIKQPLSLRYQLIGANEQYANGNPYEMEKIIRELTTNCTNC